MPSFRSNRRRFLHGSKKGSRYRGNAKYDSLALRSRSSSHIQEPFRIAEIKARARRGAHLVSNGHRRGHKIGTETKIYGRPFTVTKNIRGYTSRKDRIQKI